MSTPDPGPGSGAPQWLRWARELQSIAQAGLTYSRDPYDLERFQQVRRLAAELAAAGSGDELERIEGFFAGERGYPTPKLDVRAAVIRDGRILLVQERDDNGWALPGGWADVGESAARAAERETWEEAGVRVRATKLIALLDRERRGHPPHPEYSYKAIFACAPITAPDPPEAAGLREAPDPPEAADLSEAADPPDLPEPAAGAETLGAAFFTPAQLPPLSLARVLPAQIELAFAHAAAPELPTVFD